MKKLFSVFLAFVLVFSCATAETLKEASFDDLIAFNRLLVAEVMSRPEWKETEVPAGEWRIGEDIPAGTYSITPSRLCTIDVWKTQKDDYANYVGSYAIPKDSILGKITLNEGWLIIISSAVTFSPPAQIGF